MTTALKAACTLYALLMTMLGGRWLFAFDGIATEWHVEAIGAHGFNNLTADMTSLFIGSAIMIALGLRRGHSTWLLATALLMALAALGRIYGYATQGWVPATLVPLLAEVLSCALLVATHTRMTREDS